MYVSSLQINNLYYSPNGELKIIEKANYTAP